MTINVYKNYIRIMYTVLESEWVFLTRYSLLSGFATTATERSSASSLYIRYHLTSVNVFVERI